MSCSNAISRLVILLQNSTMADIKRKASQLSADCDDRSNPHDLPRKRNPAFREATGNDSLPNPNNNCTERASVQNAQVIDDWCDGFSATSFTLSQGDGEGDLFDNLDDEDFAQLLGSTSTPEPVMPPSSVLRNHSRNSNSAEEFDPKLQHSPAESSTKSASARSNQPPMLETDVDWEPLRRYSHNKHASTPNLTAKRQNMLGLSPPCEDSKQLTLCVVGDKNEFEHTLGADFKLEPFRTFIRIRDLVQTKSEMFQNSKNTVFELFARVLYSTRENFSHKQYFQFRDLFEETPPYLSGTLGDWRAPVSIRLATDGFLAPTNAGSKCYCQCLLIPDERCELGWSLAIRDIRPVTWKDVRLVVDHLGLRDLDRAPGLSNTQVSSLKS